MAPSVTTVLTVARTGSRVVRYLIRPAGSAELLLRPGAAQTDLWLPQSETQRRLRRGASLTRRGLGLVTLLVLAILGAALVAITVLTLGLGVANGSHVAAWLLGLTVLLAAGGAFWTVRRASSLLRSESQEAQGAAAGRGAFAQADPQIGIDEANLLSLLRTHESALPAAAGQAFYAAVIMTRDALRLTAQDITLQRDTFDVRQAARQDLPELLDAYHSVPPSRQSDEQLLEQLQLIEQRMAAVKEDRALVRQRDLSANGRYLKGKYQGESES